jgi:serine/threonine-protein kinase
LLALAGRDDVTAAAIATAAGSVQGRMADYDASLDWLDRSEALLVRIGDPPSARARMLVTRGATQELRGELDEALQLQARAVELLEEGEERGADLLEAKTYLASTHLTRGEPQLAEAVLVETLTLAISLFGERHPALAGFEHQLGYACELQSRFDEALAHYRRAREMILLNGDTMHPELAQIESGIGGVHYQRRELDAALAQFEKVHEIRKHALGPDHPYLAGPIENMGLVLAERGDEEGALEKYREALAQHLKSLPRDHMFNFSVYINMGNSLKNLGRYEESEASTRDALDVATKAFGEDSTQVAGVWQSLGSLALKRGDEVDAKKHFDRAVALYEKAGPLHFGTAAAVAGLGESELMLGNLDAAQARLEQSIALIEKDMGPDHPELDEPLRFLAEVHRKRGETKKAEQLLRRAKQVRLEVTAE